MNLREAAQQALDALELGCTDHDGNPVDLVGPAITALRSALADNEPVTDWHEKVGGKLVLPLTAERLTKLKEMNERGTIRRGHVEEMLRSLEAWHRSADTGKTSAHIADAQETVAAERERIAAWVEDMCADLDAKTIANGIRNNGNDDIRAFEVRK